MATTTFQAKKDKDGNPVGVVHSLVTVRKDELDRLLEVEKLAKWLTYVNMGDTYTRTLIHYNGRFNYLDWGTIIEREPRRWV